MIRPLSFAPLCLKCRTVQYWIRPTVSVNMKVFRNLIRFSIFCFIEVKISLLLLNLCIELTFYKEPVIYVCYLNLNLLFVNVPKVSSSCRNLLTLGATIVSDIYLTQLSDPLHAITENKIKNFQTFFFFGKRLEIGIGGRI